MSAQQLELPPLHELPAYSSPQFHDPRTLRLPPVLSIDPLPPPRIVSSAAAETSRQTKSLSLSLSLPPPPTKPPRYQQQPQRSLSIKDLIETPPEEKIQAQPQQQYFPPFPHQVLPPASSPITSNGADADLTGSGDLESVVSVSERSLRAGSVLSMEDPDVRIAAEALGDLRADCVASPPPLPLPPQRSNPHTTGLNHPGSEHKGSDGQSQPEPFLSLLTSTHPLLSTAIHGSISAYSSSKSYSPRFKYGAELVERHIGSPVASTVESVGRRTGVEGSVRRWLGRRGSGRREDGGVSPNQGEDQAEESASKRRRVDRDEKAHPVDIEMGLPSDYHPLPQAYSQQQRRLSQASLTESLPAYDDHRSPSYELTASSLVPTQQEMSQTTQNPNWQTRLMLSTSGLGVAMSEESLRSLKYCLTCLRWANVHLGKVIVALKSVVEEWDQSQRHQLRQQEQGQSRYDGQEPPQYSITNGTNNSESSKSDPSADSRQQQQQQQHQQQHDPPALLPPPLKPTNNNISLIPVPAPLSPIQTEALARRVHALKSDVLSTLKKVVNIVSTYAGGALPDNARQLVRKHLTSLPQRFHLASSASSPSLSSSSSASAVSPNPNSCDGGGGGRDVAINGSGGETIGSAQRVLVLAREGLDMMAQVSGVLDGTIVRAEEWCERLGKKKVGEKEEGGAAAVGVEEDRRKEREKMAPVMSWEEKAYCSG